MCNIRPQRWHTCQQCSQTLRPNLFMCNIHPQRWHTYHQRSQTLWLNMFMCNIHPQRWHTYHQRSQTLRPNLFMCNIHPQRWHTYHQRSQTLRPNLFMCNIHPQRWHTYHQRSQASWLNMSVCNIRSQCWHICQRSQTLWCISLQHPPATLTHLSTNGHRHYDRIYIFVTSAHNADTPTSKVTHIMTASPCNIRSHRWHLSSTVTEGTTSASPPPPSPTPIIQVRFSVIRKAPNEIACSVSLLGNWLSLRRHQSTGNRRKINHIYMYAFIAVQTV